MLSTLTKTIKPSFKIQKRSFSKKFKTLIEPAKQKWIAEYEAPGSLLPLGVATTINVAVSIGFAHVGIYTPFQSFVYSGGSFCIVSLFACTHNAPFCGYGLIAYFPLMALATVMATRDPVLAFGFFITATTLAFTSLRYIRIKRD